MKNFLPLLILTTLAATAGWHPLKNYDLYKPAEYHLKSGIGYVELRLHYESHNLKDSAHKHRTRNSVAWKAYRKPLKSFGAKIVKKFRRIKSSNSTRHMLLPGSWHADHLSADWYHNGLMLDTQGKMWWLETYRDLIDMLVPIDTPAEVALVMWIHRQRSQGKEPWDYQTKYRKNGHNYYVLESYKTPDKTHGGCYAVQYRYTIDPTGKITQQKRTQKHSVLCSQ